MKDLIRLAVSESVFASTARWNMNAKIGYNYQTFWKDKYSTAQK